MYRILTFFVSGLVSFLLIGTGVAQQLRTSSPEAKPEIGVRPETAALHQMQGTVKDIDLVAQTLRIKNRRGEQDFSITPKTQFKKGRAHLKLAELKPGSEVMVKYREQDGKKQASIVRLR